MVWKMPEEEQPTVYLTFDDGPHETATPFVLDCLKTHDAKASFFCIGKNVLEQPALFQRIVDEGHTIGNHTHNHFNGWKTSNEQYFKNILKAAQVIPSNIFRPPYGRIKLSQARKLMNRTQPFRIYMWDVLSGDFDVAVSPEECLKNVLENIEPGSIVVFHDSEKAFPRMSYALPEVLQFCKQKGWQLKALPK
jgi:peptidoglycan/xylan/chitin deacetylase (PgdA/CDA1 family)